MTCLKVSRGVAPYVGLLFFSLSGFGAGAQIPAAPTNLQVDGGQTVPTSTLGAGWTLDSTKVGLAPKSLNCASLPAYTGSAKIPAGSRIAGVRFTGTVDLSRGDIVIERSCFRPTSPGQNAVATTTDFSACGSSCPVLAQKKVIIRDSEFDGTLLSQQGASTMAAFWGVADLQRNYVHHFGSGIALYNTGNQLDALVEHNYIVDMISYGNAATTGNHSDGFTIRDFNVSANPSRQAIIRNNYIDTSTQNATGSFFVQDTWNSGIGNITATGNMLLGDGYEMAWEQRNAPVTNIRVTNNRFMGSTDGGYGACYKNGGVAFAEWSNNFLYNASNSNNAGTAVSC